MTPGQGTAVRRGGAGGWVSSAGSIINNASIGVVRGIPGLAPYAAAKRGVVCLPRSAALEGVALSVRRDSGSGSLGPGAGSD
jgi:NAD(P)-dependent dehydrogenase (short-subunit alcohol dehydrogenase family)